MISLVCGLYNETIRQRLFAEDNLTYGGAIKLAGALEAAERDAAGVDHMTSSVETPPGLHVVGVNPEREERSRSRHCNHPKGNKSCTACGNNGHNYKMCRHKTFVCSKCKMTGYLRRVCPRASCSGGKDSRGIRQVNLVKTSRENDLEDSSSSGVLEEELHQWWGVITNVTTEFFDIIARSKLFPRATKLYTTPACTPPRLAWSLAAVSSPDALFEVHMCWYSASTAARKTTKEYIYYLGNVMQNV
ncbi:hypothetical protein ACJJTC_002369 [Scirpophaga incertulas]